MATTIEQQVTLDEALIPSTKRLRIGRSNFRLPSYIQLKESTLQVVYDVLRQSPFFKAFLVTADVPEIYMQEFWATAYVHQHSVIFKMDTRKNIVDLESFREMLHISPRIKTLTDVNVNKLYQPWRSFAAVINKCLTRKSSGFDNLRDDILFSTIKVVSRHQNTQQYGAILPIELTTEGIRNTKAYKEYYACATGEATPKPKASARKKKGGSASFTTPPTPIATPTPTTTVVAAPRLSAAAKGKQPARATSPTDTSDVEPTEAEQLKIVLGRSRQETYISQHGSFGTDEGTGSKPGVLDVPSDDSEEEISWNSSNDEDVDDQTKGSDDNEGEKTDESDDDDDDDQDEVEKVNDDDDDEEEISKIDEQEATESGGDDEETESDGESEEEEKTEKEEESFRDVNINQGRGIQANLKVKDSHVTLTLVNPDGKQISFLEQSIPGIVNQYMDQRMNKAVKVVIQIQSDRLRDKAQRENVEFLRTVDENMKKIIKEQTSYVVAADLSEMELKKKDPLLDQIGGLRDEEKEGSMHQPALHLNQLPGVQMEEPSHPVFETSADDQPIVQTSQHPEWFSEPRKPPTPDHDWNKTLPAAQGNAQSWISALAKQTNARSSFNELLDTPIDFSNFIMNRLGVDTLTPELLAGPTYELMRGHPLPLIPDNQGRRVIPFEHFINNDLEYLRGGASSQKYTTSVTKTKAADYGHIKWIEDLVPRTMWIQEPLNYDKHALWGVSHWGRKHQQFYGFAVNQESALDVYSKRRIIAVTDLKIAEWQNYKHLDWISVRRDDDKIYKFKEGDFKRLRLQDIKDMLLLLIQGKLSNLTVEERFSFNVSLRMFTRSIVIQRRVKDLQLGVESYQKRLNLTKPDTDKKNRLMRIDELYKFSDGTLNDVRNALDDRLKGIRMQYLPTTIWRKGIRTEHMRETFECCKGPYDSSYAAPIFTESQRDLPRDIHLISVEVLRYEKKQKSEKLGRVPTEMELILEYTQQGISYKVSVSVEGVEELKRNDKIKGVMKEARQKPGQYICYQKH
nr:hypothetical protein [Tanacetum cinerariifolium]